MKVTGIVRRVDELGRVVIPKEIRKTLGIKEGEPLEIFTDKNMVCFAKYNFSVINKIKSIKEEVLFYTEHCFEKQEERQKINKLFSEIENIFKSITN